MGRPLRIELANAFYHTFSRGNERRDVFYDDTDRAHFSGLLGLMAERFEIEPWAYVLMPNHYHLVLRTLRPNLSRAMQWLGVAYTNWFNARHDRNGHLFQGRFKAVVIEDEAYLRRLLLYVHRNPVRAGLVERLADYPWSSYRCLAYGRGCAEWFSASRTLALFGGERAQFRRAVQDYSEEADSLLENLLHGIWLGTADGLKVLAKRVGLARRHDQPQTRAVLRSAGGETVAAVAEHWADVLGLGKGDLAALRRPRRHVVRPLRDVLMLLVWSSGDRRLREIAEYFGVGPTGVAVAARRGQAHLEANPRLSRLVRGQEPPKYLTPRLQAGERAGISEKRRFDTQAR